MKTTFRLLLPMFLLLAGFSASGQDAEYWLFEGVITEADPSLAPDLQSGWILAGSFLFAMVEMEDEPVDRTPGSGRLGGGISGAELTVDLYHQVHFEAVQVADLAGFDYQDNDPAFDGRDMLGWFFPMRGDLKESGWSSTWLQVWLADPEGEMLRSVPPRISPYGIAFQSAWFRLTFVNAGGETAFADGRMEFFGPQASVDSMEDETSWRGVAIELSEQLMQRDSIIDELRADLASSQARLEGLRNMVDLLVNERESLRQENALLEEEAAKADPEIYAKLTEMEAEKSLLESRIGELSEQNQALAGSLAESEVERRKLVEQFQELEERLQATAVQEEEPASVTIPVSREGRPVGTMTIVEEPMVIEKPVAPEGPAANPPADAQTFRPAPPKQKKKTRPTRRLGPRKFR